VLGLRIEELEWAFDGIEIIAADVSVA